MAVLQWVEDLNTGIEEIDIQHRRIVDYINRLHELRESPDRAALSEVIAETVDYTISHFAYEERMLEDSGYAFTDLHKRVHELFTRRVGEMQTRFEAGEDVAQELHTMLSRWLFSHIRNEDHCYVDAVKTYQRMTGKGSKQDIEHTKQQVMHKLEKNYKRKGFFARLFG